MARPTLNNNPKYRALIRRMARHGIWQATVRGLLEELWDSAHESGNPTFPNAEQVEAAAKWEGEPGIFAAELIDLKFLDTENGNLEIHDYWVHAPDYVVKRAAREAQRIAKGKSLSELRAEAGKIGGQKRWQTDSKSKQIAITPAPAPAPLNINTPENRQTEANGRHLPPTETSHETGNAQEASRGTITPHIEPRGLEEADRSAQSEPDPYLILEVYQAYPRHEAKKRALESIAVAVAKHGHQRILAATRAYAQRNRSTEAKYLPYPSRWFDEERYLDFETTGATTKTDRTQEAIERGQAMLDQGASYADTMSRLHDQYGDETAGRAVRLAGWKRQDYPGRQTA